MKLGEIFLEDYEQCEVVYCDVDGNELNESAIRQMRVIKGAVVKKFRCLSGPKSGRLVSTPSACGIRKDPAKVRRGRQLMRQRGAVVRRKGAITKRKAKNQQIAKVNARLAGKTPAQN